MSVDKTYYSHSEALTEFKIDELAGLINVIGLSEGIDSIVLPGIDFNHKKYYLELTIKANKAKLYIMSSDNRGLQITIKLDSYRACDGMSEWDQSYINLGIKCFDDIDPVHNNYLDFNFFIKSYTKEYNSFESLRTISSKDLKDYYHSTAEYVNRSNHTELERNLFPIELHYDDVKGTIRIGGEYSQITKTCYEVSAKDLSLVSINDKPVRKKDGIVDSHILEKIKEYLKIRNRCISIINNSAFSEKELNHFKVLLLERIAQKKIEIDKSNGKKSKKVRIKQIVSSLSPKEQTELLTKLLENNK